MGASLLESLDRRLMHSRTLQLIIKHRLNRPSCISDGESIVPSFLSRQLRGFLLINGFGFLLIIGFYPGLLSRDLHHRLRAKPYSGLWRTTSKGCEISANNEQVLLEHSSGT
jgi:hypothetical protein